MDLIPPEYVDRPVLRRGEGGARCSSIVEQEAASQAVEEYTEEHAVEEGLLWEAVDDDKITKTLAARGSASRSAKARGRRRGRDRSAPAGDQAVRR